MGAVHELSDSVLIRVNQAVVTIPAKNVIAQCLAAAPAEVELVAGGVIPRLGEYWPGQGGLNAGLMLTEDRKRQHYLIVPPRAQVAHPSLAWEPAKAHAAGVQLDGHADFSLMLRREGRLAWVNVPDEFMKDEIYWTAEQYGPGAVYAWGQYSTNGNQDSWRKGIESRVLAVRRLFL